MLSNPSQILLRNIDYVAQDDVLLINHEADDLAKQLLTQAKSVTTLALDFNHYLTLKKALAPQLTSHFGHQLPASDNPQQFDTVIIYFPKAKALIGYLIELAAQHLTPGGQLMIVGENKGGIKSLPKLMPAYFSTPVKRDNARHCLLFTSQLISEAPSVNINNWVSQYPLATPQGEITICNAVGTFSEKKLDAGTELLLQHLPDLNGQVLDFGCGTGVISAALLKQNPSLKMSCIDINAMALLSCELTLAANDMRANIYPSDGFAQITQHFNAIVSNPPFHDGLNATTDIATAFVKDSAAHLIPQGIWQIVANRHLPYADTIALHFDTFDVPAQNNKYKLYACHG
ncbi:methyltransferase [Shewanella intestini]|uniref:Ribosomal RNA small subunit methyltransferase C n=1 Tax=Shewanella intestini TaxID=2017544 RepID=A0ABS5I2T4_9GAMM|nr:methyltransferase [Shewanella sp. XMDDZSB0408]MBR9728337.1 methyltransferase [Shewanella intestini]MRG36679.1 methyltransferase [Shewanella sp. XMDDZSB0408]